MNVPLWVVQVLLALAFIAAGGMKVFAYEKYKAMSEKKGAGLQTPFAGGKGRLIVPDPA